MTKTEYSDLVFIIMERKGNTEDNYLMSDRDFKKFFPNSTELLNHDSKAWTETTLNGGTKLRIRKCTGMQDFNYFANGNYNDINGGLSRYYFHNLFYTADDGGLSCKNLFSKSENIYYLY